MKKWLALFLVVSLFAMVLPAALAVESDYAQYLGAWYYVAYEDLDNYPGTVFQADGEIEKIAFYTDGENLIMVEEGRTGTENRAHKCSLEDGVLNAGIYRFMLENGNLVMKYEYDGAVHAKKIFAREPQQKQIASSVSQAYQTFLTVASFDGAYDLVKYGTNDAYVDAEEMNMQGTAVIENGKLTITWVRNGVEKTFEIVFDPELNEGRLYTVINDAVSYIITMRYDGTLLLTVGLAQSQWLLQKKDRVSEETVHISDEAFEAALGAETDWWATEESRNRLASLLMAIAVKNGIDPELINWDAPIYLANLGTSTGGHLPLLICEGKGACANYILSIGRGVSMEDGKPFFYYQWENCMDIKYVMSYENKYQSVTEYQANEILYYISGKNVWPVTVSMN